MLTNDFYLQLTRSVRAGSYWTNPVIAIGGGDPAWDRRPPVYSRTTTALNNEIYRKPVELSNIVYLDSEGQDSESETTSLAFRVTFGAEEGEGTIRECGLIVSNEIADEERLVSYFTFARVEKALADSYERQIVIDLTPRSSGGGQIETRFLGNSGSRELHDLDNQQTNCQINEIDFDRRFYFSSPEAATTAGYDFCAHCFGRELSQR